MNLFLLMFLCSPVLIIKVSFFFLETFKKAVFIGHSVCTICFFVVVVVKYHLNYSLDDEIIMESLGHCIHFFDSQGKRKSVSLPFKIEKLISYLTKIQFPLCAVYF